MNFNYDDYCHVRALGDVPGVIRKPDPVPVQSESARRKGMPLFQGFLMYFPDAVRAVAEHSRKANEKHNPGEKLHWAKEKSKDHADCIARHLLDIGPDWGAVDPEFDTLHATALAWRAMALLQTVLERGKEHMTASEILSRREMATYRDDTTPAGAR